jgi:hypothetical protein
MPRVHREYAITLALAGVLLAIGVPRMKNGQVVGALCVVGAVVVVLWALRSFLRERS